MFLVVHAASPSASNKLNPPTEASLLATPPGASGPPRLGDVDAVPERAKFRLDGEQLCMRIRPKRLTEMALKPGYTGRRVQQRTSAARSGYAGLGRTNRWAAPATTLKPPREKADPAARSRSSAGRLALPPLSLLGWEAPERPFNGVVDRPSASLRTGAERARRHASPDHGIFRGIPHIDHQRAPGHGAGPGG